MCIYQNDVMSNDTVEKKKKNGGLEGEEGKEQV